MLPASKVHVGAGRDHAVEHLLELVDQRYVLGAIVLLQPNHAVEQREVLRHFALSAVIVVAAAVATEQLPNAAFLFASSGCTAPQPPAGRPRRPLGTACGQERPGAPPSFAEDRGLRPAPRSSTCTERAR